MNWPRFRHVERQARRMHDMMERLDVDAGKLARLDEGRAYAMARERCLNCADSVTCLKWLVEFDPTSERPEFCPNATLFTGCASHK